MSNEVLKLLRRCYERSSEPVLLLDEKWNVVWCTHDPGIGYLPELLGIDENSWESCCQTVHIGESRFLCNLTANEQDGVRIVTLCYPENSALSTSVINDAVQSISAACSVIVQKSPEQLDMVRVITGACCKFVRMTYLQNQLDRRRRGIWKMQCFSVRSLLIHMKEQIENTLGDLMDVTLNCDGQAYINGDMDVFETVMLSAIALCYRDENMRQELELHLEKANDTVCITINMTPTPEERNDLAGRISGFGEPDGERMLLNAYCKQYNGKWMQNQLGDTSSCRLEFPVSDSIHSLELTTNMERSDTSIFGKYKLLLSRIGFRGTFC